MHKYKVESSRQANQVLDSDLSLNTDTKTLAQSYQTAQTPTTNDSKVFLITGTRKGIGKDLSLYYLQQGHIVCGCSRGDGSIAHENYRHFCLDVNEEKKVVAMVRSIAKEFGRIDILLNNAGIASMNHILTTPYKTLQNIFSTNVFGSFLFIREVAKVMARGHNKARNNTMQNNLKENPKQSNNAVQSIVKTSAQELSILKEEILQKGDSLSQAYNKESLNQECSSIHSTKRIVNFATVATPLRLEGEAVYAASKAAIVSLTQVLAKELSSFGITINAVGPTPVPTDLIKNVPKEKMQALLNQQAIKRFGEFEDVLNVIEFFLNPRSDFITGQVIYLDGANG